MRGGEQDRKKRSQSLSLTCEVCLPEARCTLSCFLSESSLQGKHRRDRTGVNTKPKSQALHLKPQTLKYTVFSLNPESNPLGAE